MSSKSVSQIFLKSYFKLIDTFVLRGVSFSRYVQLKSPFLTKKTSAVKSEKMKTPSLAEVGTVQIYS